MFKSSCFTYKAFFHMLNIFHMVPLVGTHKSKNSSQNIRSSDQTHLIGVGTKTQHLFYHSIKTTLINIKPISTYPIPTHSGTQKSHQNPQLPKLTSQDQFIFTKAIGISIDATTHLIIFPTRHRIQLPAQHPISHIQNIPEFIILQPNSNSKN